MRPTLLLGTAALLALSTACASQAGDCVGVAAAEGAAYASEATLAEVTMDGSGSRTVRSAEGVRFTANRDGSIEIVGTDGKRTVVDASGSVTSSERDVRVVTSDGARRVYDTTRRVLVTETEYEERASSGSASAARTGDERASTARTATTAVEAADDGGPKAVICHVPPGNPGNQHTLSVGTSAVDAHLKHGDYEGECDPARAGSKEKGKGKK